MWSSATVRWRRCGRATPRAESIDPASSPARTVVRQQGRPPVHRGLQLRAACGRASGTTHRCIDHLSTVLLWASHGVSHSASSGRIIGSLASSRSPRPRLVVPRPFHRVAPGQVRPLRHRAVRPVASAPAAILAPARWDAVWSFLNVLLGIGIIYIVIGFGLLELALWALKQLRTQLVHIVSLLARTLPVLLILVVFLLFAVELWQVAHSLHLIELVALLGLMLLIAGLLIVTTFRPEIQRLDAWDDWDALLDDARQRPLNP